MALCAALVALVGAAPWARAQAEPAPAEAEPAPLPPPPPPLDLRLGPAWHLAVAAHFDVLFDDGPATVPMLGYGGGVQATRALLPVGRARFGVGADFAYERFARRAQLDPSTPHLAHATFAALLVLDALLGRLRPWLAVGGGFSVADYEEPMTATSRGV